MNEMTLAEFQDACKAQADRGANVVVKCPMCQTLQTSADLIAAGAGKDFDAVQGKLGFSCVGRWTGAGSPRRTPDGKPCNWTLGGLLQAHALEVVLPDGERVPHFELATPAEAEAHRAKTGSAS